jgi:hypothetical protein
MGGRLLAGFHVVELKAHALVFEQHLHVGHNGRAILTPN